jgi:hypothetical protein
VDGGVRRRGDRLGAALGSRIGSFVLIAIYAGATVYFVLFPEHATRFVRGGKAGSFKYQRDLEARARDRGDITRR